MVSSYELAREGCCELNRPIFSSSLDESRLFPVEVTKDSLFCSQQPQKAFAMFASLLTFVFSFFFPLSLFFVLSMAPMDHATPFRLSELFPRDASSPTILSFLLFFRFDYYLSGGKTPDVHSRTYAHILREQQLRQEEFEVCNAFSLVKGLRNLRIRFSCCR